MKRFLIFILLLNLVLLSFNAQYHGYGMTVKTMDGSSRPLTEYINTDEGHVTLFVFWKTCCPTNLNMIDSLLELTDEYGNSDDETDFPQELHGGYSASGAGRSVFCL